MRAFDYEALPGRVIFGSGASRERLGDELDRLNAQRVMVFATDRELALAEELVAPFRDRVALVYGNVLPHVPAEVATDARAAAREHTVDALLSIGGGSTTGTAKIVALTTALPVVAVPTTYAGSEMTPVWGMTTDARKETGIDRKVLPVSVVYDPELVQTLPRELAVSSALNAMAHCVEALWTPKANPVTSLQALDGAAALARGLRATDSSTSCSELLYGAYLAGAAFAVAGSGLHHKICHALGGGFNLPHAETHAVVLPHVLAFNESSEAISDEMTRLAEALSGSSASQALASLYDEVGAPRALSQVGLKEEHLEEAADIVVAKLPIDNPRQVDRARIEDILRNAYEGIL